MFIEIDPQSPQPIFEQIALQIKFAVAAGTVRSDEFVPSVRELATSLALNPNTIARAYRELQNENIIAAQRGIGLVVVPGAKEICIEQRQDYFAKKFNDFINETERSRLSKDDVKQIVSRAMNINK
ncbi:MAG: GntR family transcriptional regulator [Planctomycetaceae bacterium]|jgi:GntR family transcriptional regulator|nr:GntR family transcriptional regulator [Planctomycetaceae bacterium]